MERSMEGKVALVTGAASGLGRATALKLAAAGASVAIVDVNGDGLAETRDLMAGPGADVLVHVADLSDPACCGPAVAAAVDRFGQLDALCNVAGIVYFAHSADMPFEQYRRTVAVNLTAPFLLSQAAIPHLLDRNGAIVNVASSAAMIGVAYGAAYAATKAGLVQMTKSMAMEYSRKPIRINAVAPGGMATNIGVNITMPEGAEYDLIQRYGGLRGLVEVDDAAAMVVYLASDAGRSVHGACIAIDAGVTAG